MIPDWSTTAERHLFLADIFGRYPYAQAGTSYSSVPLFDWTALERILRAAQPSQVRTVADGRLVDARLPASSRDVRALMAQGVSTVIIGAECLDTGIQRLASEFESILSGKVVVQLYATPSENRSYGWHYDFEDVFVTQTMGVKDYYMRENTVAPYTRPGEKIDFECFRLEKSTLMTARLIAGDWLYIPRRWWHLVKCVEDSLSISVGVMPLI